jgi:hypothetical protein
VHILKPVNTYSFLILLNSIIFISSEIGKLKHMKIQNYNLISRLTNINHTRAEKINDKMHLGDQVREHTPIIILTTAG